MRSDTRPGRRARQRRELLDEITAEARRLLELGGPAAVGWNAIARKVQLSPSSLYTYFDGLDQLFTELLLQSYRDLSQTIECALEAFKDAPIGDRLLVGPLAYRQWAVQNPAQFNLIFTDQLPGYVADPDGPTLEAELAVLRPIATTFAEALNRDPEETSRPGPTLNSFLGFWAAFHGLTMLEANHHLDWTEPETLFEEQIRWFLHQHGMPAPAKDTSARMRSNSTRSSAPRRRSKTEAVQ
jgi:AcrR family transcriptional regulator